jgi:hypothetical protein
MTELSSVMLSLTAQSASLAFKGTATAVTTKIKAAKEVRDVVIYMMKWSTSY